MLYQGLKVNMRFAIGHVFLLYICEVWEYSLTY